MVGTRILAFHKAWRLLLFLHKLAEIGISLYGEVDWPRTRCGDEALKLPHSYYFTTCILVLKFTNKGVYLEEIQDSHFPRKGIFWYQSLWIGEKGVNFDVQCFTVKMRVHLGWKVSVLPQKRGLILDWRVSVLLRKRGRFKPKSQCFAIKKGVIFKLENKDGYHFFQWVREPGLEDDDRV